MTLARRSENKKPFKPVGKNGFGSYFGLCEEPLLRCLPSWDATHHAAHHVLHHAHHHWSHWSVMEFAVCHRGCLSSWLIAQTSVSNILSEISLVKFFSQKGFFGVN
jgi:hypothetical protein